MFLDNFQYKKELPLFVFLILQEMLSGRMNEWGSIKLQFEVGFFLFSKSFIVPLTERVQTFCNVYFLLGWIVVKCISVSIQDEPLHEIHYFYFSHEASCRGEFLTVSF